MDLFGKKNNGIKNNGLHRPKVLDFEWISCPAETVFERLKTSKEGLAEREAKRRQAQYGYNEPAKKKKNAILVQFLSRFLNPLVI